MIGECRQHGRDFPIPWFKKKKCPGESTKAMRINQQEKKGPTTDTHVMLAGEAQIFRGCTGANLG